MGIRAKTMRGILLSATVVLANVLPAGGYAQSDKPDAAVIVKQVRERYGNLRGYHFEHTILVEEIKECSPPAKISDVTFVTASEKSKDPPRRFEGLRPVDPWEDARRTSQMPFNLDRFRFTVKHARGETTSVSNGKTSWMYVGQTNEYKKGDSSLKVLGPTASAVYAGLHLVPLGKYFNENIESPKITGEEEIEVGKERKTCYVIEGVLKPKPLELPGGVQLPGDFPKDFNPLAGVSGVIMQLQIHGLIDFTNKGMYLPLRENAQPARITLWIDRQEPLVHRSQLVEKMQAPSFPGTDDKPEMQTVEIRVTDTFSVVRMDAPVPDDFFQFTPPADAKEVSEFTPVRPPKKE